jgi:hypothetical protein
VARFTPRLTAGVGVLVAFVLLGGSATEAVADPGRSHSDRDNSSDRGNGDSNRSDRGNGHGNGNRRGGSDRDDDHRRGNDDGRKRGEDDGDGRDGRDGVAGRGGVESPEVQFGSGPIDLADIAEMAPSLVAGKSGDGDAIADPGSGRVDVADVADVAELAPSLATVFAESGVGGSPDRSGSYGADAPTARFSRNNWVCLRMPTGRIRCGGLPGSS